MAHANHNGINVSTACLLHGSKKKQIAIILVALSDARALKALVTHKSVDAIGGAWAAGVYAIMTSER